MKLSVLSLAFVMAAAGAWGDQLFFTAVQSKDGTFQGYEEGHFQFMTTKGRFMKESSSRVLKLVLEGPQKASYQTTDANKEEFALLKGYDKKKFTFQTKDGKEAQIPVAKVKTVSLVTDEAPAATGDAAEVSAGRYPIPKIDLAALAGGELAPAQQAVLDKFKEAKKAYDDFVAQSSTMVADMDKMTGAKREDLLNKLRVRKGEEQPLKNALISAFKGLTAAFADPGDAAAAPDDGGVKEKPAPPAAKEKPKSGLRKPTR
jgi:hypothetical protein